jgi:PAS domain S-box-containing protein
MSRRTDRSDELDAQSGKQPVERAFAASPREPVAKGADAADEFSDVDLGIGLGEPQRVGRFRFCLDGQRWEWSDAVARMHGYEPGRVVPTTELLLQHKHLDDRQQVAAVLDRVLQGEPFSSRHRIIDTAGHTRWVVVVGERMLDDAGAVIGTSGFYVDVTESLQSDITTAISEVAVSRAQIEQAKGVAHGRLWCLRRARVRHLGLALPRNQHQSPRSGRPFPDCHQRQGAARQVRPHRPRPARSRVSVSAVLPPKRTGDRKPGVDPRPIRPSGTPSWSAGDACCRAVRQ